MAPMPIKRRVQGTIRSPLVKRNVQSQVTLQGWLLKLEGGALKQWKQRWCVLADFCLFFYKAPHEGKVISSILLPSYKINPCCSDDKVSKKFAFKAEHQNMKTYYFAAEEKENMKKWMNAMSLASIMQKFVSTENFSVEDEDSGFASYRSRRNRSSDSQSTNSKGCEFLKQRSNSCGDRVGEINLRNDDEYPNHFEHIPSQSKQDISKKQPLYVNAPPKPRRLIQLDDYPLVPGNSMDSRESYLMNYDPNVKDCFVNPESSMCFLPLNVEMNNSTCVQSPFNMDPDISYTSLSEEIKNRPLRPHSADFLQSENECVSSPTVSQNCRTLQHTRPKSSMDYCCREFEDEEHDFDNYRNAVRVQADNLYSNRNYLNKSVIDSQKVLKNPKTPVSAANTYTYNSYHALYGSSVISKSEREYDEQLSPNHTHINAHCRKYSESSLDDRESIQRLREWKQRMLQSPLTKRGTPQSTPVVKSTCKELDLKSQKPSYQMLSSQDNPKRNIFSESFPYHDQNSPNLSSQKVVAPIYCQESDLVSGSYMASDRHPESPMAQSKSVHENNIMYCVDSENNEILFSYDTGVNAPTAFLSAHYPPKMHSFSTMPNVSDIGTEEADHPGQFHQHDAYSTRRDLPAKAPREIAYTSDDEDVIEDCHLKEVSMISKDIQGGYQHLSVEGHSNEVCLSLSPDYVNIGAALKDSQIMYSSDSAYRHALDVNKAELKQLDQFSKTNSCLLPKYPHATVANVPKESRELYTLDSYQTTVMSQTSKEIPSCVVNYVDDEECDIKREDYYRASQKFYSSMRMKKKISVSPHKNAKLKDSFSDSNHSRSPEASKEELLKQSRYIDRDLGIPLYTALENAASPKNLDLNSEVSPSVSKGNASFKREENQTEGETDTIKRKDVKKNMQKALSVKKKLTYEEMRGQLLRKREAPPPNIVQDRIKKFENVETCQVQISPPKLTEKTLLGKKYANRSFSKRNRHKLSRSRSNKRALHSDSEAIHVDDSDASSDDMTMKSAPIVLSPLSSVLVDLRKAADSGKEKSSLMEKDSSTLKNSSEASFKKANEPGYYYSTSVDDVYLPMYGIKAFNEPEYVMMSGNKIQSKYCEEHVYNEPISPPSSFLHDVYGKQKAKQYLETSSSDESVTENIYEKPVQRFPFEKSSSDFNIKKTNFVLMNSLSCSNVSSTYKADDKDVFASMHHKKNKVHHYEQAHLSVSVPDLLQLQGIKDSDASDADDEASRDFDAAGGISISSYQTPAIDNLSSVNHNHSIFPDSSSKSDLKISPVSCPSLYSKINFATLCEKEDYPVIKSTSCKSVSDINYNVNILSASDSKSDASKSDISDGEKKIHIRTLRMYTKGKKPEAPKIFPVPFNLEESPSPKTDQSRLSSRNCQLNQPESLLSENVAYVSSKDLTSKVESASKASVHSSYAPDIISCIKDEETGCPSSLSWSKSSNSMQAPYYYSDLYSGHTISLSDQFPSFNEPPNEKNSPRSCTTLLNNIKLQSPSVNKSDIGRKVNNIHVETDALSDKPVFKHSKNDQIKNFLDMYGTSETKDFDSQRKHEADIVLEEKVSLSNQPSPNLNHCSEPVYENLKQYSKNGSHSLEEIPAALQSSDITHPRLQVSPVYENINFYSKRQLLDQSETRENNSCHSHHFESSSTNISNFVKTLPREQSFSDNKSTNLQPNSHKMDFLDKNSLTFVSQQNFYSESPVNGSCLSGRTYKTQFDENSYIVQENFARRLNAKQNVFHLRNVYDTDSASDATSSNDEASGESDYRHEYLFEKVHSEDRHYNVKASKESRHLKKLFNQSHGLMNKGKQLSVSAGDLLGKTHEELVLLLIQLRRNQSKILRAKKKLEKRLKIGDGDMLLLSNDESSSQDELCRQILHLQKQYEVTQPLVTLVDNMVKLGSLYGSRSRRSFSLPTLDCADDESSSRPILSHQTSILSDLLNKETDLQKCINKMNNADRGLQFESNSISSLCQDKEMLEHTLSGMQNKILDHQDRPAELQKLRKQQKMIEKELVRVKRLLNTSAKKIEDAASKNDQMEQEILHLRHILQQALKTKSSETKSSEHERADLEAELTRLQSVLDELANHRHEINNTVEKLKGEACLSQSKATEVRASPTGVAGSAPLPLRKKHHNIYLETDLDSMITRDLAIKDLDDIPVYANAEEITVSNEELNEADAEPSKPSSEPDVSGGEFCSMQDINDADERMKRFYGILPKEKPSEIKTVRIVKRQSERRNRVKEKKKISYNEQSSVWVMEEPDLSSDDYLEMEEISSQDQGCNQSLPASRPTTIDLPSNQQVSSQSAHERLFGIPKSLGQGSLPQALSSKKFKRRHYTVSGYQYLLDPQFSQYFTERPRSRDDVDMERCLRTANTPDIVRSTIKKKDVFDVTVIDRELGLPQKIEIPERYVEVEPEQLSAKEKLKRSLKAENICKMLSQTTTPYAEVTEKRSQSPEMLHQKLNEEKRKRAQLLSLNQALAREVVERSKVVAANIYSVENHPAS